MSSSLFENFLFETFFVFSLKTSPSISCHFSWSFIISLWLLLLFGLHNIVSVHYTQIYVGGWGVMCTNKKNESDPLDSKVIVEAKRSIRIENRRVPTNIINSIVFIMQCIQKLFLETWCDIIIFYDQFI